MDVLVLLEERPADAGGRSAGALAPPGAWNAGAPLAHVNSVPGTAAHELAAREIVTLYGEPTADVLAMALAAALVGERAAPGDGRAAVMRHLGVFEGRGAVGDLAWRDARTGQLLTQDLEIPFDLVRSAADQLLVEHGALLRRTVAGLAMTDWPEGTRRAIRLAVPELATAGIGSLAAPGHDALLASLREADGNAFEGD